jgi:hypothetical protein
LRRRRSGGGSGDGDGGGFADLRRRRHADELEPASLSFFVFFSHDDIFIARQWRQRWSMRLAMDAAVVCIWHRRPHGRFTKAWPTFAINTGAEAQAPSRQPTLVLMAIAVATAD